jgi:hypothetical protein
METVAIKEQVDLYKNRKLSWLELAKLLDHESRSGKDYRFFESLGLSEKIYNTMLRAYRFLSVRRLLNNDIKGAYESIGLLPATYRRLKHSISEAEFDDIITAVLSGKITTKQLSRMGRGIVVRKKAQLDENTVKKSFDLFNFMRALAVKKKGPEIVQKAVVEAYHNIEAVESMTLDQAFGDLLCVLEALMQEALDNVERKELKKKFGTLCHDLAIELECIADEDFLEARNEKEQFKL